MGRGESVAWTGSVLSEACEALIGEATSRNGADVTKDSETSFRAVRAATAGGVGEASGEGDVAFRRRASRRMTVKPRGSSGCPYRMSRFDAMLSNSASSWS